MRVCYVDRFIAYPTQMYNYLQQTALQQNHEIYFIGPITDNQKDISSKYKEYIVQAWSKNDFVRKLVKQCKKLKPDITHISFEFRTFGSLQSVLKLPILLFLLRLTKTKIILSIHTILIYKENNSWKIDEEIPVSINKTILKVFSKIFFKMICYQSNKIIVYSEIAKKGLVNFYKVDQNKIKVMRLGMPENANYTNEERDSFLKPFKGKKIILLFGLISPRKGHETAIRAFHQTYKNIPNSILIIAGKTNPEFLSYKKYLLRLVNELGLQDRIIFTDYLEESKVAILFDSCKVVVYPYAPTAAGTASFMYALKHEKPTIVSNIDTFKEILNDKSTIYVKQGDVNQLSEAITNICSNQELENKLKLKMKQKKEYFKWEKTASEHLKFYEKTLKEHNKS